ncbi:uncharacterized protein FFM5_15049 [Fusarium fujikuroi]|nr:uncharacterized protein FFM5_15049 [Fusarium fujikuroi]
MAVSYDFIVGLVFNILGLATNIVAIWQTRKRLATRQFLSITLLIAGSPAQPLI